MILSAWQVGFTNLERTSSHKPVSRERSLPCGENRFINYIIG